MIEIASTIAGVVGSGFLFFLAWKFFGQEKYPTSTMLAVIGAALLLCSFPWFQGFVKTWLTGYVNSKLADLGNQVNAVQETTTRMQTELSRHQVQIDDHQNELNFVQARIRTNQVEIVESQQSITNQYQDLFGLQRRIASTQTNLDQQQKKIEDVEFLVENLYSKMEFESFSATDTNHVFVIWSTNGVAKLLLKLDHIPIPGSIQGSVDSGGGINRVQSFKQPVKPQKNLLYQPLYDYDLKTTSFSFQYVKDTRETNVIVLRKIQLVDKYLFVNDEFLWVIP